MNTANTQDIYNEFLGVLASGDEIKAQDFLDENLHNLPQELQDKITLDLFEDAITQESAQIGALNEFKQEGLSLLKKLQKAKKDYEDVKKAEEIKAKM